MNAQGEPEFLYFRDSLQVLQTSIALFHQGQEVFNRVAARQLRILLCDTTRRHNRMVDISLLPRLQPQPALPPVFPDAQQASETERLPLAVWLEQPLAGDGGHALAIREFIRRVCDQDGGAHVDPKAAAGLADFPQRTK